MARSRRTRPYRLSISKVFTDQIRVMPDDLKPTCEAVGNLGWTIDAVDGADVYDVCEGCHMPIMKPDDAHLTQDSVTLCTSCWDDLTSEESAG